MGMRLRGRRTSRTLATGAAMLLLFVTAAGAAEEQPWKLTHKQGVMHFVYMDAGADEDQYRLAIADLCGITDVCQVLFWTDAAMAPTRLPMTDAQVDAQVAQWQRNANSGLRRMLWSCKIVNDPECF